MAETVVYRKINEDGTKTELSQDSYNDIYLAYLAALPEEEKAKVDRILAEQEKLVAGIDPATPWSQHPHNDDFKEFWDKFLVEAKIDQEHVQS